MNAFPLAKKRRSISCGAGWIPRFGVTNERQSIRRDIEIIDGWLDRLIVQLED